MSRIGSAPHPPEVVDPYHDVLLSARMTRPSVPRVTLANSGDSTSMSSGEIVGIVEDRCLDHPIYKHPCASPVSNASGCSTGVAGKGGGVGANAALSTGSMVCRRGKELNLIYFC